jgi:prolyl-tRNA editing enzyme YbaK/EbsC (Cys-tRNA(Pro) deacylase)
MSLKTVKDYFTLHNMDNRVITLTESTATVSEAAAAHGVTEGQICKTLSFKIDERSLLVLLAGDMKVDNKKFRSEFEAKPKMLSLDEAREITGHEVGGICPFGLASPMEIYLDVSLKEYEKVIPAAGDKFSAIALSIDELETHSASLRWVDVGKK